jgi:predicted enzyme related to lactoylglutathione lyase
MANAAAHPVMWFEVMGKSTEVLQPFYRQLFGWAINSDNPKKYGEVDTGAGRGIPGGIGQVSGDGTSAKRWVTFYVETPDIEATLADVARLGGMVALPRTAIAPGTVIGLFEDPEGHVIGLIEAQAASA